MVRQINSKRLRAQASWEQIEKWAVTVCADGDAAEDKTRCFLLLMDEVVRSQFDRIRIELIAFTAMRAAFGRSVQAEDAMAGYRMERGALCAIPLPLLSRAPKT